MSAKRILANSGQSLEKDDERKRSQIPVRTSAALRNQLAERAASNDRSLTQEIEQRLERSIIEEQQRGGPVTDALIANIVAAIAEIEGETGAAWSEDVLTFFAVREAIAATVAECMPVPAEFRERQHEAAVQVHQAKMLTKLAGGGVAILDEHKADFIKAARDQSAKADQAISALETDIGKLAGPGRELYEQMEERRAFARRYGRRTRDGA